MQKDTLFCTESSREAVPVQEMPHSGTIFPPLRELLGGRKILFLVPNWYLSLSGGGGVKCPAACHFGRKCRLVNNLNGNGVNCVCLKHKNGGKNEQLQWTE